MPPPRWAGQEQYPPGHPEDGDPEKAWNSYPYGRISEGLSGIQYPYPRQSGAGHRYPQYSDHFYPQASEYLYPRYSEYMYPRSSRLQQTNPTPREAGPDGITAADVPYRHEEPYARGTSPHGITVAHLPYGDTGPYPRGTSPPGITAADVPYRHEGPVPRETRPYDACDGITAAHVHAQYPDLVHGPNARYPRHPYQERPQHPELRTTESVMTSRDDYAPRLNQRSKKDTPYICLHPGCGHQFARTYDLDRHVKTHFPEQEGRMDCPEGKRDHWCGRVGDRGFTRRDHLEEHLRKVHQVDPSKGKRGDGGSSKRKGAK
ncbi:MAG: hypothetical protein Q9218_005836 [Villophora microphyllina]